MADDVGINKAGRTRLFGTGVPLLRVEHLFLIGIDYQCFTWINGTLWNIPVV
jgi:hypothetical protein